MVPTKVEGATSLGYRSRGATMVSEDLPLWRLIAGMLIAVWQLLRARSPKWVQALLGGVPPPELRQHRDMQRLIRRLGKAQSWLPPDDTQLVKDVREKLWRVLTILSTNERAHAALFSGDSEERCRALRYLSQVPISLIDEAMAVVDGISNNMGEKRLVKKVARVALEEMKERQRMAQRNIAG